MGGVRLISPRAVAVVAVLLGATITGCGVALVFGMGWGVIVLGVLVMAVAALGIDVQRPDAGEKPRRPPWVQQARTPDERAG